MEDDIPEGLPDRVLDLRCVRVPENGEGDKVAVSVRSVEGDDVSVVDPASYDSVHVELP